MASSLSYAQGEGPEQTTPAAIGRNADEREEKPRDTPRFEWKQHPSLQLWKDTHVEFRFRLQGDLRTSAATMGDSGIGDTARRRIGIAGDLTRHVEFQIERELTSDDPWRDVYANYQPLRIVQVQGGKFKLPFSLEENTSAANLDFVYRSMTSEALAPGRDRGLMVHGRTGDRMIGYQLGVFEHEGRNARTDNPHRSFGGRTLAGRMTARPFRLGKSVVRTLEVGVAMTSSGLADGLSGLRGHTALGGRFYTADALVNGRRKRLGVEFQWEPGPISIKSEYVRLTDERVGQSIENTDLSPLIARGSYISGMWQVPGPRQSWPGALELGVRIEILTFGRAALDSPASASPRADVVLANHDRALTFGLNWSPMVGEDSGKPHTGGDCESESIHTSSCTVRSRVLRVQLLI